MTATPDAISPLAFFQTGLCVCGKHIFRPDIGKYPTGHVVSLGGARRGWQWGCKNCGMVYIEPADVYVLGDDQPTQHE